LYVEGFGTTIAVHSGSDYGYTSADAIQLKGSVCHSNGMDLIA